MYNYAIEGGIGISKSDSYFIFDNSTFISNSAFKHSMFTILDASDKISGI